MAVGRSAGWGRACAQPRSLALADWGKVCKASRGAGEPQAAEGQL